MQQGNGSRAPLGDLAARSAPGEVRIRRALLSVSDKRGILDLARGLSELGVELVSTGGTAEVLAREGFAVRPVSDLTGFPEIMDGRVKTLHPKIHAALLARRDRPEHLDAAAEHDIEWIDLVCVNLYPFERTVARRGVSDEEALETIDIGGPTMIRAAAKNSAFTAVITSPASYDAVLAELRESGGQLSLSTREYLAAEAFAYTARYDSAVARWFAERQDDFPNLFIRSYEKVVDLPYGENPHQRAAYYSQVGARTHVLSMIRQRGGRPLSWNNIADLDAGRMLLAEFQVPACVIIKHQNPCGCALGETALEAYRQAFAADPLSAFGGVICLNRPVDRELAEEILGQFAEVVFARSYDDDAVEALCRKPNLRTLQNDERRALTFIEPQLRGVMGGLLIQDVDMDLEERTEMEVVTKRRPTDREWNDMLFAWRVCKHVRSNAIVLARDHCTIGVGAGQMSRVDSVRIALEKARADSLPGAAVASDAFFPFSDGPQLAIEAGATAIIQPGGSVRDSEVIEAADHAGVTMVFTARRHFRH